MAAYQASTRSVQAQWNWTAPLDPNPDKLQDVVAATALTADGSVFAFASWGTGTGATPTVRAFTTAVTGSHTPFVELVTPGSPFALDIAGTAQGVTLVVAGKKIHANIDGDGGDAYLLQAAP